MIDKPEVTSLTTSPYAVLEGETATLECTVADIKRNRSGSYSCTASNTVGTSEAVIVDIDVQCEKNR